MRKTVLQVAQQHFRVVIDENGANALVRAGHEDGAQRAGADGKADHGAAAAGAKRTRRHAQQTGRCRIQAAAGIEAGRIQGFRDVRFALQAGLEALAAPRRRIRFRRDARVRLEDAVEVKAAHAGGPGKAVQVRQLVAGVDQAADVGHDGRLALGQRRQIRLAAQAGTKAGRLRLFATGVESHVAAQGGTRGAGRPAIHARRAHRVIKDAVGIKRAPLQGIPAFIVSQVSVFHGELRASQY
ncbi:hypothetical protein D3C72_1175540 [compost metagenome]